MQQFSQEEQPLEPGQGQLVVHPDQQQLQQPDFNWLDQEDPVGEENEEARAAIELMQQMNRPEKALSNEELWKLYKQVEGQ
ncbi:MAG TPA: hypothetical protein VL485_05225 [Ktedonobacteraceae bacterium]|jgi:hypothetical protein|nr:hypothetical protein [Ktedonobacteraceae bacterium]